MPVEGDWQLKTGYFYINNEIPGYSTPAVEPRFLTFTERHTFNRPMLVVILLDDSEGGATQKYKQHTDYEEKDTATFVGTGWAQLERYSGAAWEKKYDVRILNTQTDHARGVITLTCADWLSQLDDNHVDYETREELKTGVYESNAHANIDDDKIHVRTSGTDYYMHDAEMNFPSAEHNAKRVVFVHKMAGDSSYDIGPYDEDVTPLTDTDTPLDGEEEVWLYETGSDLHTIADDDADFVVRYYFYSPVKSNLYNSISHIRVEMNVTHNGNHKDDQVEVQIYNFTDTQWESIGFLREFASLGAFYSFTIPDELHTKIFHGTDGHVEIRFNVDWDEGSSGFANLYVHRIRFKAQIHMDGDSGAYEILATLGDQLKVDSDLTDAGVGIWEGCPYAIADKISEHVKTLTLANDPLKTLVASANVESTSFYIARLHTKQKPLAMLRDWARASGAAFWCQLDGSGDPELYWRFTWTPSSPPSLTDGDVLQWEVQQNYTDTVQKAHVYGIRYGTEQIYKTATDSQTFGTNRSVLITNPGVYTGKDAIYVAEEVTQRRGSLHQILTAYLPGWSSYVLGDDISVTSTYLGLTSINYWVVERHFDLAQYMTVLVLHPDVAHDSFVEATIRGEDLRVAYNQAFEVERKAYFNPPSTDDLT